MKLVSILLIALLALFMFSCATSAAMLVGGFSEAKPPTDEEKDIFFSQVQPLFYKQLQETTNIKLDRINTRPIIRNVAIQIVAGRNYLYDVDFNNERYQIKVYRDLQNNYSLLDWKKL